MQPLPVSPRNSSEAVANLMKKTSSHRIIITADLAPLANAASQLLSSSRYDVNVEPLFSLYDIFFHLLPDNTISYPEFVPYPAYDKPYDPDEIAMILHSSGSTGLPKPVPKRARSCSNGLLLVRFLSMAS